MAQFVSNLANAMRNHAQQPAFVAGNERLSFLQLSALVGAYTREIERHAPPGAVVAAVNNAQAAPYAAMLACWITGRTWLPIEADWPTVRTRAVLQTSGCRLLFASEAQNVAQPMVAVRPYATASNNTEWSITEAPAHQAAYILFTSGSTGKPKGVPISYGSVDALLSALSTLNWQLQPTDRVLQMARMSFDLSILSCLPAWLAGACVYLPVGEGPTYLNIAQLAEAEHLTVLPVVPSALQLLAPYANELELQHVRLVLFGGEALPKQLVEHWRSTLPQARFFNLYGPSEAAIVATAYEVPPQQAVVGPDGVVALGNPLPEMEWRLEPLANAGELWLSGPQVFAGYLDADAENPFVELDCKQWYRTGDLVWLVDEQLVFCGRADRQVQLQGHRVEPEELEVVAMKLFGCTAAAVAVPAQSVDSIRLVLLLESTVHTPQQAWSALAAELPAFLLPTEIYCVTDLPRNQHGDLDRTAIQLLAVAKS